MSVVRFPPLPPIPMPAQSTPDERQRTFERIAGNLGASADGADVNIQVANTTTGFRASAVDLGFLQEMLSQSISSFGMADVRERWDDDVFRWFRRAIMTWVQRCKLLRFHLGDHGVRIEMETQDDRGYYRYEFDVFPGRP